MLLVVRMGSRAHGGGPMWVVSQPRGATVRQCRDPTSPDLTLTRRGTDVTTRRPSLAVGRPSTHHPRVRQLVAAVTAALCLLAVLGVARTAVAAGPYDTTAVDTRIADLSAQLASQQSRVATVTAQLTKGTAAWEAGKAQLVQTRHQQAAAEQQAEAALARVAVAQEALDSYAASAYQQPGSSTLQLFMSIEPGDFTEAITAATLLSKVGASSAETVTEFTSARRDAQAASAAAIRLARTVAGQEKTLAAAVKALQEKAQQTSAALTSLSDKLDQAQAERQRILDAKAAAEAAARKAAAEKAAADRAAAVRAASDKAAARKAAAQQAAAEKAAADRAAQDRSTRTAAGITVSTGGGGDCAGASTSNYANGQIPSSALCPLVGAPGHRLRADAAAAFNRMTADYMSQTGSYLCVTDSYRSYSSQVDVYSRKPSLAAVPGTSNHGWGVAVDFCGGIESFGSTAHEWMKVHAGQFGWAHPSWAEPSGSKPEPWHWEYQG